MTGVSFESFEVSENGLQASLEVDWLVNEQRGIVTPCPTEGSNPENTCDRWPEMARYRGDGAIENLIELTLPSITRFSFRNFRLGDLLNDDGER